MYNNLSKPNASFLITKSDIFDHTDHKGLSLQEDNSWNVLLDKVAKTDCRQSFKKLFDHFFPMLVSFNTRSGLKKEVAAELAQDAMIKVWKQAATYDATKGEVSSWIYVIARNVRYDYLRKMRNDPVNAASSDLYTDLSPGDDDHEYLETLFDIQFLRQKIDGLPLEQKDVIEKIYFKGLTQQEIVDETGIPLGTIKSRVRLAISALKKLGEEN